MAIDGFGMDGAEDVSNAPVGMAEGRGKFFVVVEFRQVGPEIDRAASRLKLVAFSVVAKT